MSRFFALQSLTAYTPGEQPRDRRYLIPAEHQRISPFPLLPLSSTRPRRKPPEACSSDSDPGPPGTCAGCRCRTLRRCTGGTDAGQRLG